MVEILSNELLKYLLCIAIGVIVGTFANSITIGFAFASLSVGIMNALQVFRLKKQNQGNLITQQSIHESELKKTHLNYCLHIINTIKPLLGESNFEQISHQLEAIENALLSCKNCCKNNSQKQVKFINHRAEVRQWILSFSLNTHGKTTRKSLSAKETTRCLEFLKDECNQFNLNVVILLEQ